MKDQEMLTVLHRLRHPTFFTRDEDLYTLRLCHGRYCLVYLAVAKDEVASFVRRLLRHPEFNTVMKRMELSSESHRLICLSGVSMPSTLCMWRGAHQCREGNPWDTHWQG